VVTVNTALGGTGNLNLVSSGTGATAGTLVLGATGTYGGSTNVAGGILKAGVANALPQAGSTNAPLGTVLTLGSGTSSGTLDLYGNNQTITGLTTSGTGANNLITSSVGSAATLTVNNDAATTNANINFTGTIQETGTGHIISLTKTGSNLLTLAAVAGNSYSGITAINGGTLVAANSTGTATGNSTVNVNSGGTLVGNGTTGSVGTVNVNNGGKIGTSLTGAGPGTLTAGAGTFNAGGTYNFQFATAFGGFNPTAGITAGGSQASNGLAGTGQAGAVGTQWDLITFTTLNLLPTAGTFTLALDGNILTSPNAQYVFPIATASSGITGAANLDEFVLNTAGLTVNGTNNPGAYNFGLEIDPNNAGQVDLTYSAVPEPTTLGLLALGALALLKRPNRRRRAA
jgi:autotransporter-associated beta strand protein